ncbi:MAG: hypothetical protein B7Z80_09135 [Rhodospirillales bacterium 20-64-7]|nr:MAG: hypothetical protein B7Z80_09135 [Rhodospirillales bacterium 20-64-7]HQT77621.1 hypothetical protein [Rhodopila sp.]
MAKKKILILRWAGSSYDSLGGLLELVARRFNEQGLDVILFAADGPEWPQQLLTLLRQGEIAFALTMSGIGAATLLDGKLLWDVVQVPLFNWCCDHPCYYPVRHVIRSQHLLHGYVFPDHARYSLAHFRANGAAYAVHLGIPPRSIFGNAPVPAAERNGRILFTKTGKDTNAIEASWRGYVPEIAHILFCAAEELLHRPTADFIPVLQQISEPRGLFFNGNSNVAMFLLGQLDPYIRYRRANMLMRWLLQHPIDVFGSGWEHLDWDGAKARYQGPLTWRTMLDRLPAYSGCLSINPLVEESVHDRVFFALAAAVPPVSDSNAFSRTNMPGLEPYAFRFTQNQVVQAVDAVLADPVTAIGRTEEAWQALEQPFSLRRSASQIVQFVAAHRLNSSVGL